MIKGGYKIVNFNGVALSGTPETLTGIYDQIVDDYDKPVMVSGVSLNGIIMDDAFAGVQEKTAVDTSKYVELTVYGGIITVTEDDEVSFVLSKTTAELTAEIGDLEDLETTDKTSLVNAINSGIVKTSFGNMLTEALAPNRDFEITPTLPEDLNTLLAIIPVGADPETNWNSYVLFTNITGDGRNKIKGHVLGTDSQIFDIRYWILYI